VGGENLLGEVGPEISELSGPRWVEGKTDIASSRAGSGEVACRHQKWSKREILMGFSERKKGHSANTRSKKSYQHGGQNERIAGIQMFLYLSANGTSDWGIEYNYLHFQNTSCF
jgi:hypothetical protein